MIDKIVDSVGNEFIDGAIVRMVHFSTNRKKYYMYKQVAFILHEERRVAFLHLPINVSMNSRACNFILNETELSYCVIVSANYTDRRELKRNPKIRD